MELPNQKKRSAIHWMQFRDRRDGGVANLVPNPCADQTPDSAIPTSHCTWKSIVREGLFR
jgi:hypothetical protein